MKTSDLQGDTVVTLTKEIENPKADRRVRGNWTKEPTFKPGRYVVEESNSSLAAKDLGINRPTSFSFTKEGDRYRILHEIGPSHPSYAAFVEACEPAEETLRTVLELAHGFDWTEEILQHLIDGGKITLADVKRTITAVKEE